MNLRPDRLEAALRKSLAPVYLIAGAEPLIVEECRDAVFAAAQRQAYLERDVVHIDARFDWSSLEGVRSAQSLFASRKILDLRLPAGKPGKEGGAWLTRWSERPDPDHLLVVSCGAWDGGSRKSRWAGAMAAAGVLVEAWPVRPADLPKWVLARMRAQGLSPDADAVSLLAELVEGNLLAARQEIEKLALLHPGAAITAEHVRAAVSDNTRFDAFRLGECLLDGRAAESLRVADGLRRVDIPIQAVTGAVHYQLAQLDSVRAAIAGGDSESRAFGRFRIFRMNQPRIRNALRRLDAVRIGRAFRALSRIDRQSKGQEPGDPWQTLDGLILDFSGRTGPQRSRG